MKKQTVELCTQTLIDANLKTGKTGIKRERDMTGRNPLRRYGLDCTAIVEGR